MVVSELEMGYCLNCGSHEGYHVGSSQHSHLRDEYYSCPWCHTTWTYIMEGERFHRLQVEFPKEKKG